MSHYKVIYIHLVINMIFIMILIFSSVLAYLIPFQKPCDHPALVNPTTVLRDQNLATCVGLYENNTSATQLVALPVNNLWKRTNLILLQGRNIYCDPLNGPLVFLASSNGDLSPPCLAMAANQKDKCYFRCQLKTDNVTNVYVYYKRETYVELCEVDIY